MALVVRRAGLPRRSPRRAMLFLWPTRDSSCHQPGQSPRELKAELAFTAKGQAYRVVRSGSTAMLFRGAEEIAVGVRPVKSKIVQILGFGLEVFVVASVCNQWDIEKLGSMRPAERKRMVDLSSSISAAGPMTKPSALPGKQKPSSAR